jgi:Cytochrome c554 and c-prime
MNKKLYIPAIIILFAGFILFTAERNTYDDTPGPYKYVGVDKCANVCHKGDSKGKQLEIWQDSKHSQAYKTLQTPEADKIAKDKGFSTAAAETPQCLKCHILGKDIDPAELDDTFDKTQGVQCETCHGPGSEYKKLSVMKDVAAAKDNGLVMHDEGEAFCKTCHNPDSPSYKEFKYDEYWEKIKHTDPNYKK